MRETAGDLFSPAWDDAWRVITTNGATRNDGACVMGRGVAAEAKARYPELPFRLGQCIRGVGNHVFLFPQWKLFSFPVKHHWRDEASFRLIERSAGELGALCDLYGIHHVVLPRPGCGNGWRAWKDVKPILEPILDDRFTVLEFAEQDTLLTQSGRGYVEVRNETLL